MPEIPYCYSIASAIAASGGVISRTRLFALIKTGEVTACKVGRKTAVDAESLRNYIERQPKLYSNRMNSLPHNKIEYSKMLTYTK
jgi:hypothetical protein